jgi:hypothetical protein
MPTPLCRGVFGGAPCALSRANPGGPIQIRGRCSRCNERRCRSHCRCARNGWVTGWQAGRPGPKAAPKAIAKAKAKAFAAPPPPPPPPPVIAPIAVPPVGRPAALAMEVLPKGPWMQRMLVDIDCAQDIIVASPWFDRKDVTDALVHRMGSGAAVTVLVDSAAFRERSCFRMRPRLMELFRAGADVYLCRGSPPFGIFHIKAVCTDRRVLYLARATSRRKCRPTSSYFYVWWGRRS